MSFARSNVFPEDISDMLNIPSAGCGKDQSRNCAVKTIPSDKSHGLPPRIKTYLILSRRRGVATVCWCISTQRLHLRRQQQRHRLGCPTKSSEVELDTLIEEATVDTYDES